MIVCQHKGRGAMPNGVLKNLSGVPHDGIEYATTDWLGFDMLMARIQENHIQTLHLLKTHALP